LEIAASNQIVEAGPVHIQQYGTLAKRDTTLMADLGLRAAQGTK
jgi:hypothetical protein